MLFIRVQAICATNHLETQTYFLSPSLMPVILHSKQRTHLHWRQHSNKNTINHWLRNSSLAAIRLTIRVHPSNLTLRLFINWINYPSQDSRASRKKMIALRAISIKCLLLYLKTVVLTLKEITTTAQIKLK